MCMGAQLELGQEDDVVMKDLISNGAAGAEEEEDEVGPGSSSLSYNSTTSPSIAPQSLSSSFDGPLDELLDSPLQDDEDGMRHRRRQRQRQALCLDNDNNQRLLSQLVKSGLSKSMMMNKHNYCASSTAMLSGSSVPKQQPAAIYNQSIRLRSNMAKVCNYNPPPPPPPATGTRKTTSHNNTTPNPILHFFLLKSQSQNGRMMPENGLKGIFFFFARTRSLWGNSPLPPFYPILQSRDIYSFFFFFFFSFPTQLFRFFSIAAVLVNPLGRVSPPQDVGRQPTSCFDQDAN